MVHPLVTQLRFARSEFVRGIDGVSEADAQRRLLPMNSISWMVGHLAAQEHYLWVIKAQGKNIAPDLVQLVGYGKPATTPPLADMWAHWRRITDEADGYLDTITTDMLDDHPAAGGRPTRESVGASLLRNIYHYWFHLGEALAARQIMGHEALPEYVGNLAGVAYRA